MTTFNPGLKVHRTVKTKLRHNLKGIVKGIFEDYIEPEIRNASGDWTSYYGKWESQKRDGIDLQICWNSAGVEVSETQLQFLLSTNRFSKETVEWFKVKGYIDADGDFFLARRWIATIAGTRNNGNDEAEYWRLLKIHGAIPNSMFPYRENEDYFDPSLITQEMRNLGKEFLKRVDIKYKELGRRFARRDHEQIQAALYQAPLQIGIPIPKDVSKWNAEFIQWDGSKQAAHSVELRKINESRETCPFDSYNPPLKRLSADYYIPIITFGVINAKSPAQPNPIKQDAMGPQIWRAIAEFFIRFPEWLRGA